MANALSRASQGEILSPMTRNMLAKLAQRGQIQEAIDVGMGRKPAAIAYGEEGLQAPAVAGGLVSLDPTDYLSGAGLAKLAAMAKVGGAGLSTLLGSRLLANKLGAGEVPSMFRQSGMFAGKGAKTANLEALAKAEELKAAGVPDSQIWKETGWTLDTPDKMPRFEIPDNAAMYRGSKAAGSSYAEDVILHPELYQQYPSAGGIRIKEVGDNIGGIYSNAGREEITLGNRDASSTALHELQHAIQQREGFASGGSPEMFPDVSEQQKMLTDANILARIASSKGGDMDAAKIQFNSFMGRGPVLGAESVVLGGLKPDDILKERNALLSPEDAYKRLAGEAEARLTQARMNLTPAERAAQYPYDPAYFEQATGVPLNSLIVRKEGGNAMSMPQDNAMTRLIREAQAQIDAENAAKNAIRYTTQDNRVRNALIGIGAGGAGVAGGYYGADYLAR